MGVLTLYKAITLVSLILLTHNGLAQARKKTNWLQDNKEYTQRWRVGGGLNIGEPTGIHLQFYKLSRICQTSNSITKKLSVDISVGKEGLMFENSLIKKNTTWISGGTRFGVDFKYYIPFYLDGYLGAGYEGGQRNIDGLTQFHSDVVGRIGVEFKILGVKLSTKSKLNARVFVEGKYNKCITTDFWYFLPNFGLKFHLI